MKSYPAVCWDNLVGRDPGPTITHSADAAGYPFENVSDWRDYTQWRSSDAGTLFVKLDAGAGQTMTADSLAIAGHNLASEGVEELALQSSDDDSEYEDCFTPLTPADDRVIFRKFPAQSHRYFKLIIPTYTNPPRIGVLFIGQAMSIPAYPDPGFDPDAREADLAQEVSKTGRLLGTAARFVRREISARFSRIAPDFISGQWVPFFANHGATPFFFAWDPDGRPEECYLVRLKEPRVDAPYERAFRGLTMDLIGTAD
jgi:hypothetical protein